MPIKSYTGPPYPSLDLKCVSKRPKVSKMPPKWPKMAPALGPAKGHFGAILGQFWSSGTNKTHKCDAQMEAFTASFCAMLAGFWTVLGRLGVFGAKWSPFGGLLRAFFKWSLFWIFWRPFGPILVAKFHPPVDVGPWGVLDPIWVSAGGKVPLFDF